MLCHREMQMLAAFQFLFYVPAKASFLLSPISIVLNIILSELFILMKSILRNYKPEVHIP